MFDNRTSREKVRDRMEDAMTKDQRVARLERVIAQAEAKGISRPDLNALLERERRK